MAAGSKHVLRTVVKDGRRVGRPKNTEVRTREHLTPSEVEALRRPRGAAAGTVIATRSRSG